MAPQARRMAECRYNRPKKNKDLNSEANPPDARTPESSGREIITSREISTSNAALEKKERQHGVDHPSAEWEKVE